MVGITIGGHTYNFSLDMFRGMGQARNVAAEGTRPVEALFPDRTFAVINDAIAQMDSNSTAAITSANSASSSASLASVAKTQAEIARDVAVGAAVSSDYPFAVTTGTASAYLVDFTPNRVVGDGFSMRVSFHTSCAAAPTIKVDNNIAYEIMDGLSRNISGAPRALDAGDIVTGMNLVLMFDSVINKMVITGGFPISSLSRDLNCNGYSLDNVGDFGEGFSSIGSFNAGVKSSGTFTPVAKDGNIQHCVNGGAFTLAPPTTVTVITIEMVNNASAGAVNLAGFNLITGDDLSTTSGHKFLCDIRKTNTINHIHITAAQ